MDSAYVLHRRRYRESSLLVDLLTLEHGRVGAVARGALGKKSRLGASLQPLAPLSIVLRGRGELLTLVQAEARPGPPAMLAGERLYSLFYINELIMRLTAAHDPNPRLFAVYACALAELAGLDALEAVLRRFETRLLDTIGLGLNLRHEADSGQSIDAACDYHYVAERGALRRADSHGVKVNGATLLGLAGTIELSGPGKREAKRLMRYIIDHHLDGRPLSSRKLFETHTVRTS